MTHTRDRRRVPPVRLLKTIDRMRAGLAAAYRSTAPGNVALLELATGAWVTQILYVAARLNIADRLADGPAHAADVAGAVGAHPDAVHRLMRALSSRGVLREQRDGRFALTAVGHALRSDSEKSLRDMVLFIGHPMRWADWGALEHAVRTGEPAAEHLRGMPYFDYLDTDPEFAEVFNRAMTAASGLSDEIVLAACDFSAARLVIDVGGGHGSVLSTILRSAPQATGLLYDLPKVVAGAGPVLEAAGMAHRCRVEGGSFMESVPAGGDVYVLKNILPDWDDEAATTILRNVRTAIADGGRLVVLEMVLPQRASSFIGHMLDMEMLVVARGRERTASQYAQLLGDTGFRLDRVIPTVTPISVIEATAV